MSERESLRDIGRRGTTVVASYLRARAQQRVRAAIGLRGDPPPPCLDPALAYAPVDGVMRLIHADLGSMLIGGMASLLYQLLHPLAMAGVDQHSRYRDEPLRRLENTALFIGTTTYGSKADAYLLIERVKAMHLGVEGVTADGQPYRASDPHLLEWVHCCEVAMFLAAYERFGATTLSDEQRDGYVREMSQVGHDLGARDLPVTVAELHERLVGFLPELRLTRAGTETRRFVLRGVGGSPIQKSAYRTIVAASVGLLPPEIRALIELPALPLVDGALIAPAAFALSETMRLALPPIPSA